MAATLAHQPNLNRRPGPPASSGYRGGNKSPTDALESSIADLLAFLIPASSAITISLGGQLPIGEIVILGILPAALILRHQRIFQRRYKWAYILMGLWLFSEVISDFYVGTSPVDRAKGMARIIFFGIDLAVASSLIGTNLRRIKLFALGLAAMNVLDGIRSPEFGPSVQWKMYLFVTAAVLLLLYSSRQFTRGHNRSTWISIALLGSLSIYFAARSAALFSLVAAAPLLAGSIPAFRNRSGDPRQRAMKLILLAVMAGGAAWLTHEAIQFARQIGIYNAAESAKFQSQDSGKLGVLFGGRPEGPVAVQAIMDSPIIGHGSYASDPKYTVMMQDYQYKMGYTQNDKIVDTDSEGDPLIPAHSHLTMAWIDGGVLGSFLWFYLLWVCGRSIVRLTDIFHPLAPLYCLFFVMMFWDILFSPFGETRRMQEAYFMVLMFNLPAPQMKQKLKGLRSSLRRRQPIFRRQVVRLTSPRRNPLLPFRPQR